MDNTVAIGLAEGRINAKSSKTMDMRFFWLVDRVRQGQFTSTHIPGEWNLANFFTKAMPKSTFHQFLAYLIVNLDNEDFDVKLKSKTITFQKEM